MSRTSRRRDFLKTVTALAAPLAVTGANRAEEQNPVTKTYTYKSVAGSDIQADVFAFEASRKRPVILWIHGGALIMGSRTSIPRFLRELAAESGFAVVSIDYRLAPETKLPGIIEDIEDAHRWIRAKGPGLFAADPDRLAVAGGSAGGYLTLMTGFRYAPRPKALVSYYGYGDIVGPWYSKPDPFYSRQPAVSKDAAYAAVGTAQISSPPRGNQRGRFYLYCRQNGLWPKEVAGHDPQTEDRWFDPYCPIRNLTESYPPTLLIHGTADTDVPYEQSQAMSQKLSSKHVPGELLTVEGAGHGLSGIPAAKVKEVDDKAAKFLKDRLD
jgi:acetyl esterase/lipase